MGRAEGEPTGRLAKRHEEIIRVPVELFLPIAVHTVRSRLDRETTGGLYYSRIFQIPDPRGHRSRRHRASPFLSFTGIPVFSTNFSRPRERASPRSANCPCIPEQAQSHFTTSGDSPLSRLFCSYSNSIFITFENFGANYYFFNLLARSSNGTHSIVVLVHLPAKFEPDTSLLSEIRPFPVIFSN